jgi:hypothetical protein
VPKDFVCWLGFDLVDRNLKKIGRFLLVVAHRVYEVLPILSIKGLQIARSREE